MNMSNNFTTTDDLTKIQYQNGKIVYASLLTEFVNVNDSKDKVIYSSLSDHAVIGIPRRRQVITFPYEFRDAFEKIMFRYVNPVNKTSDFIKLTQEEIDGMIKDVLICAQVLGADIGADDNES